MKECSATSSGTADVRSVLEEAKSTLNLTGQKTVLFLDEIHRFNKAQQDVFLPYLESGWIQLIGATTENPSFKLNSALLSRCRVFVLDRLTDDHISQILNRALRRVMPPNNNMQTPAPSSSPEEKLHTVTPAVLRTIISLSAGDARTALSLLEIALAASPSVGEEYDRTGDDHYDMISALHKSIRGSDGSAAMYWLARMLTAGEDPLFIARRLIVVASEDVGLANNHALPLATATYSACQTIGMPECRINLAHCVAYLAESPKSTRSYTAYKKA
ncbi:hypothetical protein BOTBODRAFT_52363 [Botryobasidium botryosum FD-172 SS1]|uniref:ATPase AAA-type core domain-containing protein n=1 Tax=Botryobasidium botryosum (strain FD-172 SS1) TaxID=930990 RepID=A0A067N3F6_BOTB1|nr:hypothetical protein BOTBODRAFT_52363 [Botryobasidium botryosum FD-172 SS1]